MSKNADLNSGLKKLVDSDDFQQLMKYMKLKNDNIFRVLKIERNENRHSNVLAYLFDPDENHGFKYMFLDKLNKDVIENEMYKKGVEDGNKHKDGIFIEKKEEITKVEIRREAMIEKYDGKWSIKLPEYDDTRKKENEKRIDLLIIIDFKNEKTVLCIENKIDAELSENQLYDYEKAVENTYENAHKIFIFLTPEKLKEIDAKSTAEDDWKPDEWISVGYDIIKEVCEEIKNEKKSIMTESVKSLIENYHELLEKIIIYNEESKEQSEKIVDDPENRELLDKTFKPKSLPVEIKRSYTENKKFKDAFRLLRTRRSEVVNINVSRIKEKLEKDFKDNGFKFINNNETHDSRIEFTTNNLNSFFSELNEIKPTYTLDMRESKEDGIKLQMSTKLPNGLSDDDLKMFKSKITDIKMKTIKNEAAKNKCENNELNWKPNKKETKKKSEFIIASLKYKNLTKINYNENDFDTFLKKALELDNKLIKPIEIQGNESKN